MLLSQYENPRNESTPFACSLRQLWVNTGIEVGNESTVKVQTFASLDFLLFCMYSWRNKSTAKVNTFARLDFFACITHDMKVQQK